jgi:hypothetical protein
MISIGGLFVGTIRWNYLVGATSSEQEETVELRVIDLAAGKMQGYLGSFERLSGFVGSATPHPPLFSYL